MRQIVTVFLTLFLLLLFPLVFSNKLGKLVIPKEGYNAKLLEFTHVALHMVEHFISQRTNTLVIMERCEFLCDEHRDYHVVLLQNFISNINYTLNIQLFFGKTEERPWDYNLFVIDSWWAFEALRVKFPITRHERQFYFFILLNMAHVIQNLADEHMKHIFQMCRRYEVKNVVIMYRSHVMNYIGFYTYQIFGPDHCQDHNIIVEEINRYENGTLLHQFLFPDHTNNFHGCILRACGHLQDPLLTFEGDKHNNKDLKNMTLVRGIEGDILSVVVRALNIKLRYMFPTQLNTIGLAKNSTGCFKEMENDRADLAIGSFTPSFANSFMFSYSYVYHTSPFVFVVRYGMFFGAIKQLLNPLRHNTWLLIAASLIIMIIFTLIAEHYNPPFLRDFIFGPANRHPMHNVFVILLGNTIPWHLVPRRNFARLLLFAWLFFTFELRNGYQGKMFDSLRLAKRLPIPKKVDELIHRDYTLLSAVYLTFYPHNKTVLTRNSTMRMMKVNSSDERLTTGELLDFLIGFNNQHWNDSYLTFVDDTAYSYQCVIYFRKHSMLRPSFDRKLKLLSDAGITGYISNWYTHRHIKDMKSRARRQSPAVAQITNRSLKGLYILYGIMCQLSVYVFALELLSKRSRKLKLIMDWFN